LDGIAAGRVTAPEIAIQRWIRPEVARSLSPSEMTSAQLFERAQVYTIMAADAAEEHLRISFTDLAKRYRAMAAERQTVEQRCAGSRLAQRTDGG
jgi:hypothetical protein